MFFLGIILAYEQVRCRPREPFRFQVEGLKPGKHHAYGRIEGHGKERRDPDRKGFRPCQGGEEPSLLVDQGKDREERHRDDEEREEDRGPHLHERLETYLVKVTFPAVLYPYLYFFIRVFDLDDGAVHQNAD